MPKKKVEKNEGFDEFLQETKIAPPSENRKKTSRNESSGLELLTFIEDEFRRLSKLCDFFDNKLRNSNMYSQTATLIAKQKDQNERTINSIVSEVNSPDSDLQKNIARMFDNHFKQI
ncbi:MAG: hypothetical protein JNM93_13545 [Bacteriovoracaceae bacterium]|nr:hypothetical protein [Bacteriovoracaceae bacterium]